MKYEAFEKLVNQLENFSKQNPSQYRLKLAGICALGYGYMAFVTLGSLLLVLGLVVAIPYVKHGIALKFILKGGFLLLLLLVGVLRSLWQTFSSKIPAPEGIPLKEEEFPELFTTLKKLQIELKAPKAHHVLITQDFNAGILQIPQFGVVGPCTNYLILGLPLMMGLSKDEFDSVLAHEFGHLSKNHSQFSSWVYSVDKTWNLLYQNTYKMGSSNWIFGKFFNWYFPIFDAYSFPIRREQEYEADQSAAKLFGNKTLGNALANIAIQAESLQSSFWTKVYDHNKRHETPPAGIFSSMESYFHEILPEEKRAKHLEEALQLKTTVTDSHPCLMDRLAALGVLPEELVGNVKTSQNAASVYFKEQLNDFETSLSEEWQKNIKDYWKHSFNEYQSIEADLLKAKEKVASPNANENELLQYAKLIASTHSVEEALPIIDRLLDKNPQNLEALFFKGSVLLKKTPAEAERILRNVMEADSQYTLSVTDTLAQYYYQQGDLDKRLEYIKLYEDRQILLQKGQAEALALKASDAFEPLDLSTEKKIEIVEKLKEIPNLEKVFIARKALKSVPGMKVYIFALYRKKSWLEWKTEEKDQQLLDLAINSVNLDDEENYMYFFVYHSSVKKAFEKIKKIQNSQLY